MIRPEAKPINTTPLVNSKTNFFLSRPCFPFDLTSYLLPFPFPISSVSLFLHFHFIISIYHSINFNHPFRLDLNQNPKIQITTLSAFAFSFTVRLLPNFITILFSYYWLWKFYQIELWISEFASCLFVSHMHILI